MANRQQITALLTAHRGGDKQAADRLFSLIYEELKAVAHLQLARQRSVQTVNTTALVHEVYLKMGGQAKHDWQGKAHFLAVAAKAMRHILVDYARKRQAAKRGGGAHHTTVDASVLGEQEDPLEILDLNKALSQLEAFDERLGRVVELRFFSGLSIEETAEVLSTSPRTVRRDWTKARSLLYLALTGGETPSA